MSNSYEIKTQDEYNSLITAMCALEASIITAEETLYDYLLLEISDTTRPALVQAGMQDLLKKTLQAKICRRALDTWRFRPVEF